MDREKKIVFMGSRPIGYRCLEYMIDNKVDLGLDIIGVMTEDDNRFEGAKSLQELSRDNDIPVIPNLESYLLLENFDLLISVQYHEILMKEHIEKASQIAINLHMAPLPEYRGCNQFSFAILNGDNEFGTTIHRMEEGVDSGAILFEKRFIIPKNCFVKELYDLTVAESYILFETNIKKVIEGDHPLTPQKDLMGTRKNSYHSRDEINEIKEIDPSWNTDKIFRHFRATYMPGFPPPYIRINNNKIELKLADE